MSENQRMRGRCGMCAMSALPPKADIPRGEWHVPLSAKTEHIPNNAAHQSLLAIRSLHQRERAKCHLFCQHRRHVNLNHHVLPGELGHVQQC